jgi:urea transport system permease protein
VDARAALNPLVTTRVEAHKQLPEGLNIARSLFPGRDIDPDAAYQMLVEAGEGASHRAARRAQAGAGGTTSKDGVVGGVPVAELSTQDARDRAYRQLAKSGLVPDLW